MGVFDRTWWSLWLWPEMALWCVTAALCLVVVRYAAARALGARRGRVPNRGTIPGLCFYLHEQRIMNLYKSSGFLAAMEQEVAESTKTSRGIGAKAKSPIVDGQLEGSTTRETLTTYLKEITPITVIRLLMDTLRKEDNVVDVDLTTGRLTPTRRLAHVLTEDAEEGQAGAGSPVPLSRVTTEFVSVTGRFTATETPGHDVILYAPYGGRDSGAKVKVTCFKEGIAEELKNEDYYTGEFRARCLGKVRAWNPAAGELTLDAVAIFR
ncbi:hypothetical protein [Streptomyces longispororuber]|uniref:hypothetical protein n=1 Tax=Streptomyces longispororuber TaxID=68230 RepID=UPI0021088DD1|nr:hypothetical protein [Streptomyces longispororuber]MCQ4207186.1 hypothetical protein [Streptomyces longispororuber]